MQFSVLGPLDVRAGDAAIEIRRGIPRVLLCALVVNRGEVVAADALVDRLWGEALPANPANALQTHVAYLRRVLGVDGPAPIVTRATGYALDVDPEDVDSHRFERLVAEGVRLLESGTGPSLAAALGTLDTALSLWRGRALEDVADLPFAVGEATRLEELRLLAAQRRVDALLALGRADDAVGDLAGLVAAHPLRERFHEQLVLALYRAGRQGDALRAYAQARVVLADELGLDPGPDLRRLERLVLDQAPELDWTPPPGFGDVAANESGAAAPLPPAPPLIGRAEELARLEELVQRSRLLTLTGPGGSGKTRLAIEVAARAASRRTVRFVDLGTVRADADVAATVAASLGLDVAGTADPATALAEAMGASDALVVLDTCEHVVGGASAVAAAVLRGCPRAAILATSRRPLGVNGELAWPVPPLRLPAPGEDPRTSAAVQLFLERAASVAPDLLLDDGGLDDVAEVCRALDGLPLAIELAAAQADVLPPSAIRARLTDRFALLVDSSGRAAPRQRTLLSTIDWSVQLLDDAERRLLGCLAVFVGSFDLDGAASVAGDERASAIAATLELVRSSLVARVGDDRYRLLDTVRAYALEHLLGDQEDEARRRHAEHVTSIAEAAFPKVRSPAQAAWLPRARAELGNIRAALEWCFGPGGDAALGARLAGLVAWTWTLDGLLVEASRALEQAAAVDDVGPEVRARVLLGIGLLAAPLGDLGRAREACEASAEIAAAAGLPSMAADAMITLGVTHWALGDLAAAASTHDRAIALFDERGDRWGATVARVLRARTALEAGELARAGELLDVALDEARETGDAHVVGLAFDQHARLALASGDLDRAALAARECLAQNESIAYAEGICSGLHVLGRVRSSEGSREVARALHLRALSVATRIRHVGAMCEALEDLAAVAAGDDDEQAAVLLLHAARVRERRGVPLRPSDAAVVATLTGQVRDRLGDAWETMARLVPLTSVEAVVEDLLSRPPEAMPAS